MAEEQHPSTLPFDAADEYRPEPPPPPEIPAWKDGSLRIGIHTSIAKDVSAALDTAYGLGANALQIFSASPLMWTIATRIPPADAERFRARRRELGLGPLVIHGNYLINLASQDPVLRARSVQAFHVEIVRALALGADFLVTHPGSAGARGMADAAAAAAQGLRQAARGSSLGELQILLENTAGQGNSLGSRFGELKAVLDACPDLPLGVCLDTAHWFAAGWDIRSADGLESALQHIDKTIGLDRVFVLHMNDSKTALGSRVDRHEHIGKGKIGSAAFGRILNHPLLAGRAFILETPLDKPGDDRRNVAALWKLAGREAMPVRPPAKKKTTGAKRSRAGKRTAKARVRARRKVKG